MEFDVNGQQRWRSPCLPILPDRTLTRQLEYLEKIPRIAPEAIEQAAGLHEPAATVVPYPRDVARAETGDFPDPRKKILSPL